MKETLGCEEKSVNVGLIGFFHRVGMFCHHRSKRAVFVEVIAGSFFLKALADCVAEGALLLFQKVKLWVLYQLMINHCMSLLSLTNRVCSSKFKSLLSSG